MNAEPGLGDAVRRIPVRNAWHMLLYAWDLAAWQGRAHVGVEDAPTLLGLLARVLEDSARRLLARQLGREHLSRREAIRGVRGRLDFDATLRGLHLEAGRTVCTFPVLGVDTLQDQILRATVERLASDDRVDHVDRQERDALRARLHDLRDRMVGVSKINLEPAHFRRLQICRNDRAYELPLRICELIYRLEMPTEGGGDHALTALVRDDETFRRVFEAFVRNFYRAHLDSCDVRSEVLGWGDGDAGSLLPAMRTDITITRRSPERRLVIDTKYSSSTLATSRFGAKKIKTHHLYQIYTYLRTQEERGAVFRNAEGMLLYPTTEGECDEAFRLDGHTVRLATVDLTLEWKGIEARLLELVQRA